MTVQFHPDRRVREIGPQQLTSEPDVTSARVGDRNVARSGFRPIQDATPVEYVDGRRLVERSSGRWMFPWH